MKNFSDKRTHELRHYTRVKKELEQELKESGQWACFFSGIPFPDYSTWENVTWHHCKGRDGDLLTDKTYLVPVLDKYHTGDEGWHNKPLSYLRTLWWFEGFMQRLLDKDHDLYMSVVYKIKAIDDLKLLQ